MAHIQHELKIHADRHAVLHALTNKEALQRWHSARVSGGPQSTDPKDGDVNHPLLCI
jgi:hypothetical protein